MSDANMPQTNYKTLVCIANLGTIKSLAVSDIRFFLRLFLADKRVVDLPKIIWYPILYGIILPLRAKKLQTKYQSIWLNSKKYANISPLNGYTINLIKKLNQNNKNPNLYFDYAMSYIEAKSGHNLAAMFNKYQKNYHRLLVLPLYPHFSTTTTNALSDQLLELKRKNKGTGKRKNSFKRIEFIKNYASKDEFIDTICNSIRSKLDFNDADTHLLFSYHSIPQKRVDEGDCYQQECFQSTRLIVKQLGIKATQYSISFQSRFGKAKWLEPTTGKKVMELAKKGVKHLAIICPGFSMDCLETLEEINLNIRQTFLKNAQSGAQFQYINCLNDTSEHIKMITKITEKKLKIYPIDNFINTP